MSTYLLIHGGWHGAWCWDKVAPLLRQAGHTVIAPDLPGHGRDTTPIEDRPYERYVPRICEILDTQTESVILVGHSSGGAIITAAAEERPDQIGILVYLAAFLLPHGVAPPAIMRDDTESLLGSSLVVDEERQTVTVKKACAKQVFYADCTDADADWATSLLVPEPLIPRGVAALPTREQDIGHIPRMYIETLCDHALGPATQKKMYTALPCQKVYSLPTSHSPFLSAPAQLATCLLETSALFADSAMH
ncbi:MAG: alpha/beta fold hydrolase [Thermomicrobiales bacterium]